MKFCPNCGNELDENSEFCSNCGNKLNDTSNNDTKQEKQVTPKNFNFNTIMENSKLIIIAIVAIIAFLGIISLAGLFGNDIVDVTSIEMSVSYSDTPFGGAISSARTMNGLDTNYRDYQVGTAVTKFSLMPRETITRITGLALYNTEVTLENGKTEKWGNFKFNPKDMYIRDTNYDFRISKTLGETGENIDQYYTISHIKADIVINTTDAKNKVIGHINEDITPKHY